MAHLDLTRRVCEGLKMLVLVIWMTQLPVSVSAAAAGECPCTIPEAPCCSISGFCGSTSDYCKNCNISQSLTSNGECPTAIADGGAVDISSCAQDHNICSAGSCCSRAEHCGNTADHCGAGCLGGACYSNLTLGAKIGIGVACAVGVVLLGLVVFYLRRRHKAKQDQLVGSLKRFSYHNLEIASNHFCTQIGEGGYGTVFKGTLKDNTDIAVKRLGLSSSSPLPSRGGKRSSLGLRSLALLCVGRVWKRQAPIDSRLEFKLKSFEGEIKALGLNINHKNLVLLLGYCVHENGERFLVYEFVPNKTLAHILFDSKAGRNHNRRHLGWEDRKLIAEGIANVLEYLHGGLHGHKSIVHLDIKPENILLDADLTPKLSDFGFAQLLGEDSYIAAGQPGTEWYRAPEIRGRSGPTVKCDVFSYGIVLLELVCGRRVYSVVDGTGEYLPLLVIQAVENDPAGDLAYLDPLLQNQLVDDAIKEAQRFIRLALWCLQQDPEKRPAMTDVRRLLSRQNHLDGCPVDTDLPMSLAAELESELPRNHYNSLSSKFPQRASKEFSNEEHDIESLQEEDYHSGSVLLSRLSQTSSDSGSRVR
ncbi:hypothetical protein Mapa_006721 [Marchantia paleacea]|nr:hypothetical protein Mapa_006721 [Marchantia paleacea]